MILASQGHLPPGWGWSLLKWLLDSIFPQSSLSKIRQDEKYVQFLGYLPGHSMFYTCVTVRVRVSHPLLLCRSQWQAKILGLLLNVHLSWTFMVIAGPQKQKLHFHHGAEHRCGTMAKELGLALVSIYIGGTLPHPTTFLWCRIIFKPI